ncbi:MAG: 6-phosphogluconolactonase [Luteimonas sp.]
MSRDVARAWSANAILLSHTDEASWIAGAVADIAEALRADIDGSGHARLLLSGGGTPAPVYRALSKQSLDWARVSIGLVDERWLPVGDPGSNARLARETLLTGFAAAALFEPLLAPGSDFDQSVANANQHARPATVIILGMGPDGHTASLFPGMAGLDAALANPADYVGVDASGCPGAQRWAQRISLTPAGMARAGVRLLLVRGEEKRVLAERAMRAGEVRELPVRAAMSLPGSALIIHWCP